MLHVIHTLFFSRACLHGPLVILLTDHLQYFIVQILIIVAVDHLLDGAIIGDAWIFRAILLEEKEDAGAKPYSVIVP